MKKILSLILLISSSIGCAMDIQMRRSEDQDLMVSSSDQESDTNYINERAQREIDEVTSTIELEPDIFNQRDLQFFKNLEEEYRQKIAQQIKQTVQLQEEARETILKELLTTTNQIYLKAIPVEITKLALSYTDWDGSKKCLVNRKY